MSELKSDLNNFKFGDVVIATNILDAWEITEGKEYTVLGVDGGYVAITCDAKYNTYYKETRFKLKEEIIVNEVNVEKEQYIEHFTGRVYDLVFKGNRTYVLRCASDEQEVCCYESHLKSIFTPLTKEMQKQQKKNEDLYALATVTDEIRKLLDDNYVICHTTVNRDTKGLVEYNIMLGESV
jgi:hypothetical protein